MNINEIEQIYRELLDSVASIDLSSEEWLHLRDPKMLGKYFDPRTRPFYCYHFVPIVQRTVAFLTNGYMGDGVILDFGCGSGTMSILLGSCGIPIIAVDNDPLTIGLCRKRLYEFEQRHHSKLDVTFLCADAFDIGSLIDKPVIGIHSQFAFSLMRPNAGLISLMGSLGSRMRLAITDTNRDCMYHRLFGSRRGLGAVELQDALRKHGFSTIDTIYNCLLPAPVVGAQILYRAGLKAEFVARWMGLAPWLAGSFSILAETAKCGGTTQPGRNPEGQLRIEHEGLVQSGPGAIE